MKGFAHITGGGLTENAPRVVPDDLDIEIDLGAWTLPPVFQWLARSGGVDEREMLRTFNCGIGMIAIVPPSARRRGAGAADGGGRARVPHRPPDQGQRRADRALSRTSRGMSARTRVAILISGRGSNMRALIEAARAPDYPAEIALVVSSRMRCAGSCASRATRALRPSSSIRCASGARTATAKPTTPSCIDELSRANIRVRLSRRVHAHSVAGLRAQVGGAHRQHPPFPAAGVSGLKPQAQALAAGVKVTGCTVHYVVPELDAGPTIAQTEVPVLPGDTEETLSARILEAEHQLYPPALRKALTQVR